ncbi:hypothetical protein OG336_00050 [[Kitasatospora] papulosa]|uniref:hypothetical protein n=1 Tax=[Kitasatospora] papulosa TaxID=1464011 RepID=UPI002E0DD331|nr:hypothetical protein OG336_00050 [[Kitasatospora] papulosa]
MQQMQASAADIGGRPMRLTRTVHLFEQIPYLDAPYDKGAWRAWLQSAARIEAAHRTTIAWLRSRMPGYPQLPAPQLAPGTALTTTEYTFRLAWQPGERAAGLQMRGLPPSATRQLQAAPDQARSLEESARTLAGALQASQEWQRLAAARQTLDEANRNTLRQTRARLKQRLSDAVIDAHEPSKALERHNYRSTVLTEEIEQLNGPAREFTDAFDAADRLVELAASDVLGQLTIHGRPLLLQHVTDIDLEPGTPRRAHFTVPYDPWLDTGELIQNDDPLVTDTCLLTRTTINLGSGPSRLSAQILPGTASLWEATSHSPI